MVLSIKLIDLVRESSRQLSRISICIIVCIAKFIHAFSQPQPCLGPVSKHICAQTHAHIRLMNIYNTIEFDDECIMSHINNGHDDL